MSKFAAYLRELLDQRGEPISRVARNAGLERTSIHKALKDERLLPYTALKKLTHYLQLTAPNAGAEPVLRDPASGRGHLSRAGGHC